MCIRGSSLSETDRLFQLDGRALLFQLFLELVGVGLGERFLHDLGSAFHQVLGFLEVWAGGCQKLTWKETQSR